MIFEQDSIAFEILDVFNIEQENTKTTNTYRNFDALSYRFEADTLIESNGKECELADHSISFFPSDVNYIRTTKKDKLIVVHFKSFSYHSNEIEYFFPDDHGKYDILFKKILDVWNRKDTAYKHEASSILNTIFSELYRDNKPSDDIKSKINPSVQYIRQHCYRTDFSLTEAAKKSHISETYFRKLFKKEFGISPKQYIINRRIRYASSLIIAGYHTLEEVAELCGYNDYKHFSVEFKKITGLSPSKYTYNYDSNLLLAVPPK